MIYSYVSYVFIMVLTFIWSKMLRSACIFGCLRRFCRWQTSKPDELVTVQLIHYHEPNSHKTTWIIKGHGQTAICHSLEDWPASICEQQQKRKDRWMMSYAQAGTPFPFHQRNCCESMYFCRIVYFCASNCNGNSNYGIVCPRLNIRQISSNNVLQGNTLQDGDNKLTRDEKVSLLLRFKPLLTRMK
jgi:hypothetical protein